MTPSPLVGKRVVDLSQYIAGPVCGQILADFGAEVIKVEPVGGDPSRSLRSTRFGSVYYRSFNTGKGAIALDLQRSEDHEHLEELLAGADALIMNFARRTLEKLDLTWDSLHRRHPQLTVTLVSAYGAGDPRTSFDSIAQAMSGYASLNAAEDGRPRIAGGWPTDVFSGMYAALSTAMALADPRNDVGVLIDVPMDEVSMTSLVGPALLIAAEEGTFRPGRGNADAATAPSNIYRCDDGYIYIYAGMDKHWALLRPLVDGPDGDAPTRLREAADYDRIVEAWTERHTVAELCERLDALGIPAGPIRDPVVALERMTEERPDAVIAYTPVGQAVPQFPVTFSGERIERLAAPNLPVREDRPD
jgi:crotonobetainyl-CoA:carnitine CoA-transferase CaiB-like acyl-CoA transferase